jgi:hypothetical protein
VIYFDTSYLAKCYLLEDGAVAVRQLASAQEAIACSAFGRVELVAAFHRKVREGEITRSEFEVLIQQLDLDDANGLWMWLPITHELLRATAARFLALPADCFVRSADALHLTSASESGFTSIFSNDKHLLTAAVHFGILAENVIGA